MRRFHLSDWVLDAFGAVLIVVLLACVGVSTWAVLEIHASSSQRAEDLAQIKALTQRDHGLELQNKALAQRDHQQQVQRDADAKAEATRNALAEEYLGGIARAILSDLQSICNADHAACANFVPPTTPTTPATMAPTAPRTPSPLPVAATTTTTGAAAHPGKAHR